MADGNTSVPYYHPVGFERDIFLAAHSAHRPILIKGPTGCGKTRFVEAMAAELGIGVHTVACHEDLTAADLVGRHLLQGAETVWVDGPLTRAVRSGGIAYLDEIVEARQDVTVVVHPLTDYRRILPIDRLGEQLRAPDDFTLVVSYNPGYQNAIKDLKDSTRQRMVAISLDFPPPEIEAEILRQETGLNNTLIEHLVALAQAIRSIEVPGLREVASTRTLVSAATLIVAGLDPEIACRAAIAEPLTDDATLTNGLVELVNSFVGRHR
ncbi:CbbQ/NirQ/NorQ/GpvN family protein [Mycobacterium sp. 236(2023)]|uniref:CbbQ/NirQ/NorQ/GpvN family protein n=1 Tax=Mycobacterium sp. 236(2023) TaxID=3038163 RepID=UPI00241505F2|nr:CbbQ/NirQ/NorQ/GpvN family protein [Mycobacterium sp. 236(2023)]MDG4668170.1 CbbQ/NirQ/NorQ/GpvN family protein [Mycobacterium sp. 236(2023)]